MLPPNQVLYTGAFHSPLLEANLRITCTRAAMECDVIITKRPKYGPEAFGLSPSTTLLQVRHAWSTTTPPGSLAARQNTDLLDTVIDFGDILFAPGKAFAWDGGGSTDSNAPAEINFAIWDSDNPQVPVGKTWQSGNPSILTESVHWKDIVSNLAQLPEMAAEDNSANPGEADLGQVRSPLSRPTVPTKRAIQVAGKQVGVPGFVLDYIIVSGSGKYHFQTYNGTNTYYLTTNAVFNDQVTFDPSCVIKRASTGASLSLANSVQCNGTLSQPSILTMAL
jgi:hypothetical protein